MAQFDGISKAGRDEKLSLLVGVLAEFKPLGIASIMPHTIFQQYFGYLSHPEVRNPYIPSVFSLIGRVTEHQYLKGVREPIEFIFDYQPGSNQMAKIQEAWEMFKGVAPPAARCLISAHPPQFLDDRQVRPLQAADFHVGVLRYVHEAMLNGRPVLEFHGIEVVPNYAGFSISGTSLSQIQSTNRCSGTAQSNSAIPSRTG